MRTVFVQFLPGPHGVGCLASIDLDSFGWDTARDLKGSICVWPDQAHNLPNDPNVQALITAWTDAGVTWVTTESAVAQGYRLSPPYQYVDQLKGTDATYGGLPEGADPLNPSCRVEPPDDRRPRSVGMFRGALDRLRLALSNGGRNARRSPSA